jgi:hypothetical protein
MLLVSSQNTWVYDCIKQFVVEWFVALVILLTISFIFQHLSCLTLVSNHQTIHSATLAKQH